MTEKIVAIIGIILCSAVGFWAICEGMVFCMAFMMLCDFVILGCMEMYKSDDKKGGK